MSADRRARLRKLLAEHGLDALLVTSLVNVRYLTGFTGSNAQLLITIGGGDDALVTDGRYAEQAAEEVGDLPALVVPPATWLSEIVGEGQLLGLEAHAISWSQAERLRAGVRCQVTAAPALVEELRQVKDAGEIALLRRACYLGDRAFGALTAQLEPGMTEQHVAVLLERAMVDLGAEDRAFDTIVASGANTAVPHHRPTTRPLAEGDLVKVDFGARVGGYHSDMTRMVSLGTPGGQLREIFDLVWRAQQAGLAAAAAGTSSGQVDAACRKVIIDAGYGDHFVHGTGHGIGLEIHEDPYLRPEQPQAGLTAAPSVTLRPGMTVTVEPGVYLPGVGGVRIEDSLVITAAGPDVLTHTPKDLVVL